MTRIVLTTVGTTGDLLPYLALAHGLLARGHQVRIVTHEIHRALSEGAGVEFIASGDPFTIESFNALLDQIAKVRHPFRQFEILADRLFLSAPEPQFKAQLAASKDADLVVAHRFDYLGQEAAIANQVPWVSVTVMPEVLRTHEAPPYPYWKLGRWWTRVLWDTAEREAAPLNDRVRRVLRSLGGRDRALGIAGADSPHLGLLAASPQLIEPHGDWPKNVRITGAWFHDPPPSEPSADLAAFLAAHPRPIVVTFGSMGGTSGKATAEIVAAALRRVRRPAIVQRGYSGVSGSDGGEIFSIGYVPHGLLFAEAGCVVHHAGGGTAAAVCRAGAPSVAVPHLFDQYYWAGMLHRRGVAPAPLFRAQLTPKALADRIEEALDSEPMRAKAAGLGERVRAERGVANAVREIEAFLRAQACEV